MVPSLGGSKTLIMWSYHPELLDKPVPRYTSYPTAAEFSAEIGEADQRRGLEQVRPDEDLSLYIHIPYCREICWYCACNTGAANRPQRMTNYLERLSNEIDLVAKALGGRGQVARVSFGGGSPNSIAPNQFLAIVDQLRAAFSIGRNAVLSVELDPRGFDAGFADALNQAGVQRASLGVQTFDTGIQNAIGRVQPYKTIESAVQLLRQAGISSLNFDLMYGLPQQDDAALLESIMISDALGADRLAIFGYAHVPHLIPRQRRIDASRLPGKKARFEQAWLAHETLTAREWQAVGFDHFARPHDPLSLAAQRHRVRRNFQGFTDDPCEVLIGLGASAISRFRQSIVQNERNSGRYGIKVGLGHLAGAQGAATPPNEIMRAHSIEHWLCNGVAHLHYFPDRFRIKKELLPFEMAGLIKRDHWEIRLEKDGLPYARSVAAILDPWREHSSTRFSNAV
jgi:oxygen-independent coproporphyrinogen-3 oxidase